MQIIHFAHRTEVLEDPPARHSELTSAEQTPRVHLSTSGARRGAMRGVLARKCCPE